ncbi:MAG: hypothetical protein HFI63_00765 [Lachnospiraceae bacterium]|nr:hypothetical protein [Lachnospiraceae bacterium]
MRARFVIGVGMTLLMLGTGNRAWAQAGNYIAGFDIRWLKDYEPAKEDGVSTIGEPDWDAESETAGYRAVVAGGLAVDVGQSLTAIPDATETAAPESGEPEGETTKELIEEPEETTEEEAEEVASDDWISLGDDWVITYYCPLSCCNDQWAWQTSTQEPMQLHHTIAVDPSVIPYYTHVRIGGLDYEYVAEDCGGGIKGKRIDVLVDNCAIANRLGVDRNVEVWVKK